MKETVYYAKHYLGKSTSVQFENEKDRKAFDDLLLYSDRKIGLIGAFDSGATIVSGDDIKKAYTYDTKILADLLLGRDERTKGVKIRRFYFIPQDVNILCLDIDRKNNKDGLESFYQFCKSIGKEEISMPKILQDLPNNFPCYIRSPNNGLHLYFRCNYIEKVKQCLVEGVEIKYKHFLTCAGSFKDDKYYVLHGSFENIPTLPSFLKEAIVERPKRNPIFHAKIKRDFDNSWDKITEWAKQDSPDRIVKGRNERAHCLTVKARGHGYSYDETLNSLFNDPTINDLPEKEIEGVCKSVYKNKV